ncbi:hypothetical protein B0F90DRAFT_1683661, partial [Multifurca ochricompacta]
MYDPSDGLLTFSGASLLPSEPPTPQTPLMSLTPTMLNMPDTPTTHAPMPYTPVPSTLTDMQSLFDAYFCSTDNRNGSAFIITLLHQLARRPCSTVSCVSLPCLFPRWRQNLHPNWWLFLRQSQCMWMREATPRTPPPPPDRDSVFAWSWLGRMAPEDPREPWKPGTQTQVQVQKL